MRKFILALMLFAAPAQAGSHNFGLKLNAVALNASSTARTLTLPLERAYKKVKIQVAFTRVAYTAVTFSVSCNIDPALVQRPEQTRACESGICELYDWVDTKTIATSFGATINYDVEGCDTFTLLVGSTSGGGSDNVTAYAVGIFQNDARED